MENGSKSDTAGSGVVVYPLFVECDLGGRVLWMSDRARSALGSAESLSSTIVTGAPWSFSRVMRAGDRVLLSASPLDPASGESQSESGALRSLEGNLLRHYFRLQVVERTLSTQVRRRSRGGGRLATRQIEGERRRLGRELHTGVGQTLAAIRLQLEVIAEQFPHPPGTVRQALGRISSLAADALEQVRSISRRLHPPEWQRLELEVALRQLWELSGVPQRYAASLRLDPLPREPDQEIKILLYRAAQEALSNLTRHSKAQRTEMALSAADDRIALRIQDDGVGFDAAALWSAPPSVSGGIGLRSIREQAESLGGRLQIESGPSGTTVTVVAPFMPADD